ncbi:MAG: Clp protease N-terminal domain-containing protein [Solirubrobacteraceae bacterium]
MSRANDLSRLHRDPCTSDRLTIKTQEALQAAVTLAHGRRHSQITPIHLLTALLDREDGLVTPVLGKLGVSATALRADLE